MSAVHADIIPSTNRIPWSRAIVGVPGGIPERTTVFTNMPVGSSAAEINGAIRDCPSNQVIFLPAGVYEITQPIHFENDRPGITLRGAGMGKTILNGRLSAGSVISLSGTSYSSAMQIQSGYTKGSSNVVVTGGETVPVGRCIVLFQQNDTNFVWSRWGTENSLRQVAMVTARDGNRLTFWPPLVWTFKAELQPKLTYDMYRMCRFVGIEDLTIKGVDVSSQNIEFNTSYGCWIKNVESHIAANAHFWLGNTLNCEIRGCRTFGRMSDTFEGTAVRCYYEVTGLLVEDNIFEQSGVICDQTVGSVFAYNFMTNYVPEYSWPYQGGGWNLNHGPHGMFVLFEGNVGEQFQADGYHGSVSHLTFFRNWIHGLNPDRTGNRKMVDLARYSRFCNVVGNILGDSSWQPKDYDMSGIPSYPNTQTIYRLGYPNMGNNAYVLGNPPEGSPGSDDGGLDPRVPETLWRHGNYDFFNKSNVWNAAVSDHSLPASLYLEEMPAYWGDRPWPPFDPEKPSARSALNIPAGYRYLYGANPPVESPRPRSPSGLHVVRP